MPTELGGVTGAAVRLALDAAAMRHQVIANNLANIQTEDFAPRRLAFERILAEELGTEMPSSPQLLGEAIDRVATRMVSSGAVLESAGEDVSIEREITALADNTLRYRALLSAIGRQMSILQIAIDEGRR